MESRAVQRERRGRRRLAVLPEPSAHVQARLVLTGNPGPVVTAVTLAARAPSMTEGAEAFGAPLSYSVFATREGLPGGTTANGHVIAPHDHFVALPSRRALSPNGKSDYSVRVCAPNGRCVFAPVWEVGPWNTKDDYWNPAAKPQQWADLPQGTPEAQVAFGTTTTAAKTGTTGRSPTRRASTSATASSGTTWAWSPTPPSP